MLKVNSAALREAEEQLMTRSRNVGLVAENLEGARRALLANSQSFLQFAEQIGVMRNEVEQQSRLLREAASLTDSLLTMYSRCERESSNPSLESGAQVVGELFCGIGADNFIHPERINSLYDDLINPLISII